MKNNLIGISGKIGSGKDTVGNILRLIVMCKAHPGMWNIDNIANYIKMLEHNPTKIKSDYDLYCHATIGLLKKHSPYQIKKFADKLKDIVCLLIGCTREQLEDREFKEKELGEEWWYYGLYNIWKEASGGKAELINIYSDKEDAIDFIKEREATISPFEELRPSMTLKVRQVKLTPRKLLQLLGTECGRQIIHPNIWVNALFADYPKIVDIDDKGLDVYESWIITDVRFPNEAQAIKDRGGVVIRVNRDNFFYDEDGKKCLLINNHPSETALDNYEFDYVIENDGTVEELIEKIKQLNLV